MPDSNSGSLERAILVFMGTVLLFGVLIWAKSVLISIALAILLSFALTPLVSRLQRLRLKRLYAVLAVILLLFAGLGLLGVLVSSEVHDLINNLPSYKDNLQKKFNSFHGEGESALTRAMKIFESEEASDPPATKLEKPTPVVVVSQRSGIVNFLPSITVPLLGLVGQASVVLGLTISMLLQRENLRDRLLRIVGVHRLTQTTRALEDASRRISRYLLVEVTMNGCYGLLLGIGLAIIGIPFGLMWGVLGGVMRFVPIFGVWVAAIPPLVLATVEFSGWMHVVAVAGLVILLIILIDNFSRPMLVSRGTGLPSLTLVVSAILWTWLWGPIGLVMATPMTVCMGVLGRMVPQLSLMNVFLGTEQALERKFGYYQRLLARDDSEALDLLEEYLTEEGNTSEKMADDVIIPTLIHARRDRGSNELNDEDILYIAKTTRDVVDTAVTAPAAEPVEEGERFAVVGCPARDDFDTLGLHLLSISMAPYGDIEMTVIGEDAVASEMVQQIREKKPALVVIGVVPPFGLAQARYLVKRIRQVMPTVPILVGCWGLEEAEIKDWTERLTQAGAQFISTSISDTRSQIAAQTHLKQRVTFDETARLAKKLSSTAPIKP